MAEQTSLLYLQDRHITSLRVDEDTDETFKHHRHMVDAPIDNRILHFLYTAGFYHATFLRGFKLVPGLITALIERWRPETHTFHMPCGECTITLEDVVYLIGVPVNGKPLIAPNEGSTASICERYLGKVPNGSDVKGSRVKLSWLENEFGLNYYNTFDEVHKASRAYILRMIGGILMPDKSGSLVSVRYLPFLDTHWEADCQYSWGSTILACLYRELCKGAILDKGKRVGGIGGCLLLLQAWAWQRLPFFTPVTQTPIQFPLVARWCEEKHETGLVHNNVKVCRSEIDLYCKDQFIWMPYTENDWSFIPDNLLVDSALWCSVTPLIHFSTVEFHFADRVLRQFGFHQPIPCIPRDHYFLHDFDGRGRPKTNWKSVHADYIALWNDRASSLPYRSPLQADDFESSEYMVYFFNHGKPYLTTLEERDKCLTYKKKYRGKGKSSKTTAGASGSTSVGSRNPEGWPTNWRQPEVEPVIWEKDVAPTHVQPEVGPSSSDTHGFDDVVLYTPEFIPPQTPHYSSMDFQELRDFLNSPEIMGGQSNSLDMFTTPASMPLVTEEENYSEEDAEEEVKEEVEDDPKAEERPQRKRVKKHTYFSTISAHCQKLRKKILKKK